MKRLSTFGLIFAALVVIMISFSMKSDASSLPTNPAVKVYSGSTPLGYLPAIQPEAALANQLPTYTVADAQKYLNTDDIAIDAAQQHLTQTITFVSSQDLGQKLHQDFSSDAPILCYVEFTGNAPFVLGEVHAPPGGLPHFSSAFEVFDGRTGDLLVWGGQIVKQ